MDITSIKTGLIISFLGIAMVLTLLLLIALTLVGLYRAINKFERRRKRFQKRLIKSGGETLKEENAQQVVYKEKLEVIAAIGFALDLFFRASHRETRFDLKEDKRFNAWRMAGRLQDGGLEINKLKSKPKI